MCTTPGRSQQAVFGWVCSCVWAKRSRCTCSTPLSDELQLHRQHVQTAWLVCLRSSCMLVDSSFWPTLGQRHRCGDVLSSMDPTYVASCRSMCMCASALCGTRPATTGYLSSLAATPWWQGPGRTSFVWSTLAAWLEDASRARVAGLGWWWRWCHACAITLCHVATYVQCSYSTGCPSKAVVYDST